MPDQNQTSRKGYYASCNYAASRENIKKQTQKIQRPGIVSHVRTNKCNPHALPCKKQRSQSNDYSPSHPIPSPTRCRKKAKISKQVLAHSAIQKEQDRLTLSALPSRVHNRASDSKPPNPLPHLVELLDGIRMSLAAHVPRLPNSLILLHLACKSAKATSHSRVSSGL